jgi:hypothetical protein
VLVEGDKKIYDTHNEQQRLWGYSLLISWFIFGRRSKFFENIQTFTSFLLAQSLILSTSQLPKPIPKELKTFISSLLPSFTNTIFLKHILPCPSLSPSMVWRLCKVNKLWLRL